MSKKEKTKEIDKIENPDIDSILQKNEVVYWKSKPKRSANIFISIFMQLPLVIVFLVFGGVIEYSFFMTGENNFAIIFGEVVAACITLLPFFWWGYKLINVIAYSKYTQYIITDKRIIASSGLYTDYKFFYYKNIKSLNVKITLLGKMFEVGEVNIFAKEDSMSFECIEEPYRVAKFLQKVIRDMQADNYFPNTFRPQTNRGYKTKYNPQPKPKNKTKKKNNIH